MSGISNWKDLDKINLIPNPSFNEFALFSEIKMNVNGVNVEIYNLIGQKVLAIKNYKLEETINISNLSKGTYMVKITSEDQETTKRLIKN